MKTKQLLIIPALLLLVFSGCNVNNRGKVKHPAFIAWSSMTLEVDQVELTDTTTVLYIKAYYPPKNWIKIDPDSYLADENGNQYPIRSSEGIVLGEEFYMPESGETAFVLTFPAIPATVSSIDFSEGNFDGAFNIWGIRLTDKKWPALELPKGFTKPLAGEHAVLPQPEFKNGTARIDGRILNYQKGMPKELSVQLSSPFNSDAATLQIDEKGLFSGEIEAFSTHPATVYLFGQGIQCFVAPGETTSLIINPVEVSRRQSRLRVDEESGGEPVYHGGYLAALSRELSGVQAVYSLNSFESYESFLSFLKSIENKNPEELKHLFLENYREKQTVLDTLNVSPAGKQYLACATDLYYAQQISSITSYIDRAYIHKNNLMENR
ncbi:MAG: TlpA family protein disulfide reductase, partial [Tannerella sp.]|nr:TlpA family protein disulfide reductase [Tannerella sp.]